jgi:hypothetical protein
MNREVGSWTSAIPDVDDGEDFNDVWWFWGIIIGLYLLGTGIYNFGWQIFAAIGAALVVIPLLVLLCVVLVRKYQQTNGYRLRKVMRYNKRDRRIIARQIKRLK